MAATLFLASHGWCQAPSNRGSILEIRNSRVSRILGHTVEDTRGEPVGKVSDFVVNLRTGEIEYAVLLASGFLGLGAESKAVPVQALSLATAKRNTIALKVSRDRWEQGPDFRKSDLGALNRPGEERQLLHYYGLAPASALGTSGSQVAPGLCLATDLIGKHVAGRQGENLGKVADLLVDLHGHKPAYAIVSGGEIPRKSEAFAIPLRAFTQVRGKMVVDASLAKFEQAPPFDDQKWQAAARSTAELIYRYPEGEETAEVPGRRFTKKLTTIQPEDHRYGKHEFTGKPAAA